MQTAFLCQRIRLPASKESDEDSLAHLHWLQRRHACTDWQVGGEEVRVRVEVDKRDAAQGKLLGSHGSVNHDKSLVMVLHDRHGDPRTSLLTVFRHIVDMCARVRNGPNTLGDVTSGRRLAE